MEECVFGRCVEITGGSLTVPLRRAFQSARARERMAGALGVLWRAN